MNRLRVALFLWWFQLGGTERHALRLIRGLDRGSIDLEIICWKPVGELAAAYQAAGVPIHVLRSGNRWSFLWVIPKLVMLFRRRRYDVVHSLISFTLLLGPLAAWLARVPRIVTSERNNFEWKLGGWRAWASARANRWMVDCIVVNSAAIGRRLAQRENLPADRIVFIANGLEMDGFCAEVAEIPAWRAQCRAALAQELRRDPARGPWIAMVASLDPRKQHHVAIAALRRCMAALPDAALILAGDGDQRAALEQLTKEAGVAERVHWLGRRADAPRVLAASDLMVLSSIYEGFPNAVVEALAAGTPVLSTALPYVEDLGALGEFVRQFEVGDDARLAVLLQEAWADRPWRARTQAAAPATARGRFGLQAEIRAHEAVYRGEPPPT